MHRADHTDEHRHAPSRLRRQARGSVNLAVKDKWPILQVSSWATGPHLTGGNTIEAAPRRPSKRILTDLEADKAATEITDLVEQEGHHIIDSKRRLSNSEQGKEHASQAASVHSAVTTSASAHDSYLQRADQEYDKLVIAIDDSFPPDEGKNP